MRGVDGIPVCLGILRVEMVCISDIPVLPLDMGPYNGACAERAGSSPCS